MRVDPPIELDFALRDTQIEPHRIGNGVVAELDPAWAKPRRRPKALERARAFTSSGASTASILLPTLETASPRPSENSLRAAPASVVALPEPEARDHGQSLPGPDTPAVPAAAYRPARAAGDLAALVAGCLGAVLERVRERLQALRGFPLAIASFAVATPHQGSGSPPATGASRSPTGGP